jgi:hypothetical protein
MDDMRGSPKKKKSASLREFYKYIDLKPVLSYSQASDTRLKKQTQQYRDIRQQATDNMDSEFVPQWQAYDPATGELDPAMDPRPVFVYDRANIKQQSRSQQLVGGKSGELFRKEPQFIYGPEAYTGPPFVQGSIKPRTEAQEAERTRIGKVLANRRAYLANRQQGKHWTEGKVGLRKEYQAKKESKQGCPVALEDSHTRAFGNTYVENPVTSAQQARAGQRRTKIRDNQTRGRRHDIVTHVKVTDIPPQRPETPASFYPTRYRPIVWPTTHNASHLRTSHSHGQTMTKAEAAQAKSGYVVVGGESIAAGPANVRHPVGVSHPRSYPRQRRYPQHVGREHNIITGQASSSAQRQKAWQATAALK